LIATLAFELWTAALWLTLPHGSDYEWPLLMVGFLFGALLWRPERPTQAEKPQTWAVRPDQSFVMSVRLLPPAAVPTTFRVEVIEL
jgi:hypothetical protein